MSEGRLVAVQNDEEAEVAAEAIRAHRARKAAEETERARREAALEAVRDLMVGSDEFTVWETHQEGDLNEGRSGRRSVALFLSRGDAVVVQSILDGVWGAANYDAGREYTHPQPKRVYLSVDEWVNDASRPGSVNESRLMGWREAHGA